MSITQQHIVDNHLHVGSLKRESNPKTRKYQLDNINGLTIINPDTIIIQLEAAKAKFQEAKQAKKEILVICEKSLYASEVEKLSGEVGFHYLNHKVPAGFLTNYDTLIQRIRSMNELRSFTQSDEFSKLTKKEKSTSLRKLKKIETIYKGVKSLSKKPDLVIVIDGKMMSGLISEIEKMKTDSIVIASTDFDRYRDENSLVVTNVQSHKALDFVMNTIVK